MKIAFTTPEFVTERNYHGGLANYLDGVTAHLASEYGYEVHVFVLSERGGRYSHQKVTVHKVKRTGRSWYRLLDRMMMRYFDGRMHPFYRARENSRRIHRAFLREHAVSPFGIVQAASYQHTGYEIARRRPRPYAVISRYSSSQQLWNAAYGKVLDPATAVHSSFEVLQGYHSDASFSPSLYLRDCLEPLVGKQIEVIESPCTMLDEKKSDHSLFGKTAAGKQYLLFYGSLGRLKGIEVLAEIMHALLSSHEDLYFVFIGKDVGVRSGISSLDLLKREASEHADRLIYSSPVPRECIVPFILNSRAVVLPSLVDNLPNACIESMGLGAVVIGSQGASFDQLIVEGRNGFLAERGNSSSLLNAIKRALRISRDNRRTLGANAQETVRRLRPSVSVAKLDEFYKRVLKNIRKGK